MNTETQPDILISAALAQQVIALFQESGATPRECKIALDLAREIVAGVLYGVAQPAAVCD
jgi:hypothetical protein